MVEGSTENTTLVTDLIVGLRERGLDVTRPILVVLDGAKALRARGPGRVRPPGDRTLPTAQDQECRGPAADEAAHGGRGRGCGGPTTPTPRWPPRPSWSALAAELDKTHPGAAASLREGLAETLTVLRLGVPPTLARTLRSHQRDRVDDLDLP